MNQGLERGRASREGGPIDPPERSRRRLLATASILGALITSSCCVVPLVLVTLGVSGARIGNLTALEPYKPYVLTATSLLLAAGFWQLRVAPKQACAAGSDCVRGVSNRIARSMLWIATVLVLRSASVSLWAPVLYRRRLVKRGPLTLVAIMIGVLIGTASPGFLPDPWADNNHGPQMPAAEQTLIFAAENMTRAACPITVRKAMERVEGAKSVRVDYAAKRAAVVFDPAVATPAQIGAASTNAGYRAAPVS